MKRKIIIVLLALTGVLTLRLSIVTAPSTEELTSKGEVEELFYSSNNIPLPEFDDLKGEWTLTVNPMKNKASFHAKIKTTKGDLLLELENIESVKQDYTTTLIKGDINIIYDEYKETLMNSQIIYETSLGNLHVKNKVWFDLWGNETIES